MKKGNITPESIRSAYNLEALQKPYFSMQFADTVKRYFDTYFGSSVTVTTSLTSPSNVVTNGFNLATFFKEALKLDRGGHLLNIHIEEITGFKMKITVSAEGGLTLGSDDEEILRAIARESRFDFDIQDGAIILVQKLEVMTSITLNATYQTSPLFDEFIRAFAS